jgi:chain length determinant protein EpsF
MNLSQLLSILRARKWVAIAVFIVAVATAVVVSLLLPPQYVGTASVLIDVKPDPIAGAVTQDSRAAPIYVTTQVDVLKSPRVAQRVVRNLRMTESPDVREAWLQSTGGQGSIEDWLVTSLQKNLEVVPSTQSNVIVVNYKAGSARQAADLANAFVQAYLQTSVELRVDPARQFSAFFETRVKEARDRLETAQTKLSAFQRERGLIASDERLDIETARLNELSSQLVALQAINAESAGRVAQARGASADRTQEVLSNSLINSLKDQQARNEARLQELTARYGDQHPQVIEAKANIAETKKRIDAEVQRVSSGVGVTAAVNRQREAEIRASLDAQRARVLQLKQVRDEGAVLLRDVDSAQRTYDALLGRLTQASIESQANLTNTYQLTTATPPTAPAFPNMLLNVALAVFLGGLLALGTPMLLEVMDRKVRAPMDVVDALGLPMIGIMPRPNARRLIGRPAVPALQQRLLGQLPPAAKGV